jgi:hypothetical protein
MEDTEVEVLLLGEVRHTRHKGPPERPITGPFGKDFVDRRVVDGWLPIGVCGDGQTLPLHTCIQESQDEVEDAMIARFTLGSSLGHREVRQDKCAELGFGELDRNRRGCRLRGRRAHQARAS